MARSMSAACPVQQQNPFGMTDMTEISPVNEAPGLSVGAHGACCRKSRSPPPG